MIDTRPPMPLVHMICKREVQITILAHATFLRFLYINCIKLINVATSESAGVLALVSVGQN